MNDNKTLISLHKGQAAYEKVINKQLYYVYFKNNRYYELIVKPKKENFLHLCGIQYFDPKNGERYSAKQFYDFLKKNKISIKGIIKNEAADQKLQIIDQLIDLTTCNLRIIDEKHTYLNLLFFKAIRSRRKVFALALENKNFSDEYVPSSLLNLKSNPKGDTINSGYPVHCIYSMDSKTKHIHFFCRTAEFISYEKTNTYPYKTYKTIPEKV